MNLFCPECHKSYSDPSMRVCPDDGTRLYSVDTSDPLVGATIDGRFRADYILGAGGMGTVYGGVQLSVNRDVAIKVLRAELGNKEVALERFFREAKTISKLTHPNIVKLIDFGQDRDRDLLYLAMELVRGQSMGDVLARGRIRTALALDIAYQVCGALTEPHADGVIHRDLKPDNLLLAPMSDGTLQVKVLDFGIARFMESNTQLTGTGMICGTPAYMAPEQAQNETLDPRTDLYALGVILYEALSGWPPFSGTSSLQIMLKHIQEAPPKLRELLPPSALPTEIEDFVFRLISKNRSDRPGSALEVRDQIDELRRKFDLPRVRVKAGKDALESVEPYILPKLPRGTDSQSGPTQVLRRETDLSMYVVSNDTAADPVIGVTDRLSPEQEARVAADIKVQTRQGGQQAWTPEAQGAVRSIKDTKDGVDAFAATEMGPSATPEGLVQVDSEPQLKSGPRTEDAVPQVAHKTTSQASVTAESTKKGGPPWGLITVAVVALGAVCVAAFLIDQRIQTLKTPTPSPSPPPLVAAPPEPVIEEPPVEAVPAALLDFVAARGWAERAVHDGIAKAPKKAAPERVVSRPPKVDPKPAAKSPEPGGAKKTEPKSDKPTSTDELINNLGLRKEGG